MSRGVLAGRGQRHLRVGLQCTSSYRLHALGRSFHLDGWLWGGVALEKNSCTDEAERSWLIFGMMLGSRWEGGAQRWSPIGNTRMQLLAPGGGAKHHIHCEFWPTSRPFQEFSPSRRTLTLGPPISAFISPPALSPSRPPHLFF